jgi:hypothetical protein
LVQGMTLPIDCNTTAFDGLYTLTVMGRPDGEAGVMRTITGDDPAAGGAGLWKSDPACYDVSPTKYTTGINTWSAGP